MSKWKPRDYQKNIIQDINNKYFFTQPRQNIRGRELRLKIIIQELKNKKQNELSILFVDREYKQAIGKYNLNNKQDVNKAYKNYVLRDYDGLEFKENSTQGLEFDNIFINEGPYD